MAGTLTTDAGIEEVTAFLGTVVDDIGGASTIAMVCLGEKLGLYDSLRHGPMTPARLAERSGCVERLVTEWCRQQTAAGYLDLDVDSGEFALPAARAMVLSERESPAFVAAGQWTIAAIFKDLDQVASAFRGERDLAWGDHDPCLFHGVAEWFRPSYESGLVDDWLPALSGVHERLERGGTIADVGCGQGWSTLALADRYPRATVVGYDVHAPSIRAARRHAAARGLDGRVSFDVADAIDLDGAFDLILLADCLHDMGDPAGVVSHIGRHLTDDGSVMVVEPFALDDQVANLATPTAPIFYACSTAICTPGALAQRGPQALGAQAGEAPIRELFEDAGFATFRRAFETPFNLVYEARP